MDADKRKKTITIVLVMNFIPLVIAVLTLIMIWYFAFGEIRRATLEGVTITILLSILPILGIVSYQSAFINRKSLEKKWIWELGCVNSGIWIAIFLGIVAYQISTYKIRNHIRIDTFLPFISFIYFGYLFFLNKKMVELEKNQELSQFEVNT
jgi:hypothetical protein